MRPSESEAEFQGVRIPVRIGSRAARARRERLRRACLEFLESRTLMATLPAVTVNLQYDISGRATVNTNNNVGNSSTPSVAVDPYNTQDMVASWVRDDPARSINPNNNASTVYVELATSTDGGQTWTVAAGANANPGSKVPDLSQSQQSKPLFYAQVTDPSVAFDAQGHFYVLDSPHTSDYASGAVAISKYAFNGGTPTALISDQVIYQWVQDPVYRPMLAVDSNVASQADGDVGAYSQSDPYVNNVYVAWSTNNNITDPANSNPKNPNVIKVVASSDGGSTFSTPITVNSTGNGGNDRDASPQLVISQGRAADPNDPSHSVAVPGGQVSVIWDDTGSLRATSTNQPAPLDAIMMAPITNGGAGFNFQTTTPVPINQATAPVSPAHPERRGVHDRHAERLVPGQPPREHHLHRPGSDGRAGQRREPDGPGTRPPGRQRPTAVHAPELQDGPGHEQGRAEPGHERDQHRDHARGRCHHPRRGQHRQPLHRDDLRLRRAAVDLEQRGRQRLGRPFPPGRGGRSSRTSGTPRRRS